MIVPDRRRPGEVRDINLKFCGFKLKKSAEFAKFVEESVPPKFHDRFQKSEKGIDIEMCCDALKLASAGRMERLFLLSNDGDFIPFIRTMKEFGANVSLIHLSEFVNPNAELVHEVDSYDVVPLDALQLMFLPEITPQEAAGAESEMLVDQQEPDKPEAAPSDLEVDEASEAVAAAPFAGEDQANAEKDAKTKL